LPPGSRYLTLSTRKNGFDAANQYLNEPRNNKLAYLSDGIYQARPHWAEIMTDGVTPQAAAEKAFKRIEEIFAKYPIA
jgi:hypothetical protein